MIQLNNVSKTFEVEKNKKQVLENININFNDNGLYLIKGESGFW